MKKILIILSLFLPLTTTQAITIDEIVAKASTLWENEKAIKVPNFSLVDIEGNMHTDELTKGKYLVINFWATWCTPCLKEIPAFVKFYNDHSDKVEILGLNYEGMNVEAVNDFKDRFDVNYPIILYAGSNEAEYVKFGDLVGMPTTLIYDPDGELLHTFIGEIGIEELAQFIPLGS
jgi:thiol-disulfide isomerase/thioredoxin